MENKRSFPHPYDSREFYFNREVSWLEFNARVLEEASDTSNPLLERLKFLSIFSSNLDEFFMIRVANLKDQVKEGFQNPDNKSGLTPKEQLAAISARTHTLVRRLYQEFTSVLIPELKKEGIEFIKAEDLNEEQLKQVRAYFDKQVFPVLTPMAVDSSRPFPMLMNKTLNLAVQLTRKGEHKSNEYFPVVRVPAVLPRSRLVEALANAAINGKQVTVLVELKARFDEENNINWAKTLEESGCHVIYGLVGLKTHCKISMVVRREGNGIKRYVHLSTGNYNEKTAKLYTDLGMFTSREAVGEDATLFFNHLSGYSDTPALHELVMAPIDLRNEILSLIDNEIKRSTPEAPGHMIAKMNALTDKKLIQAIYAASAAGVKVDLIVRGICCLRPGITGVSENVRVISVVGQFLEHSRVYYYQNGGDEKIYLASADWMTRNMERQGGAFVSHP